MSNRKTLQRLKEEVRRRGGILGIPENARPEMVEALLQEVLHCPLCAELDRGDIAPPELSH